MRFIGGINHGQPVPPEMQGRHCVTVPYEGRTVHYFRHDGHMVIFGMSRENVRKLLTVPESGIIV